MKHTSIFLGLTSAILLFGTLFSPQASAIHYDTEECIRITNIDDYPDISLVAYSKAFDGEVSTYIIQQNQCLTLNVGAILAVKKTTLSIKNVSPGQIFTSPSAVFPIQLTNNKSNDLSLIMSINLDPNLKKTTYDYVIKGFENNTLLLHESKITKEYHDGSAPKIETFETQRFGTNTPNQTSRFSDLDTYRYANAIKYIAAKGIAGGYPDGTFKPKKYITRAELLKIILNSKNISIDQDAANCFSDVTEKWQAQYICTAKKLGIIGGYSDNTFRPNQNISFVEALKILYRTYDKKVNDSSPWYKNYVADASFVNIVPLDIISVNQKITRGQMADMITRYITFDHEGEKTGYLGMSYSLLGDPIWRSPMQYLYLESSFGPAAYDQVTYGDLTSHE